MNRADVVVILSTCDHCGEVWTKRMALDEAAFCPTCGSGDFKGVILSREGKNNESQASR